MTESKFSGMWNQLHIPTSGEFTMGEVARTRSARAIRLALDADGNHHVLIPGDEYRELSFSEGNALKARMKTIAVEGHEYEPNLDVYCVDSSLTKTFDRLAADLIEVAQTASNPVEDSLRALGEWKSLFSTRRRRSLSPQQRIGLFAELSVLKEFAEAEEIAETSCWTGPNKEPHDFEFEYMSLEVKAYGGGSEFVTFHGPLQMDNLDGKPLYLCLREIEEDDDGVSLLALADEIEDSIEDAAKFRTTVNKLGLHDDDPTLQVTKYRMVKETLIEVNENTPRIVPSSFADGQLPEGIERLRYSVLPAELITDVASGDFRSWLREVRR